MNAFGGKRANAAKNESQATKRHHLHLHLHHLHPFTNTFLHQLPRLCRLRLRPSPNPNNPTNPNNPNNPNNPKVPKALRNRNNHL
jgi:hypothetical protein